MGIQTKRKNVLYIIDTLQMGGAEKSLLDITHRFQKYQPIFLTLFKGNYLKPAFLKKNIKVIALDQDKNVSEEILVSLVQEHIEILQPVIVHATLLQSCLISRKLSRKTIEFKLINSLVNNTYSFQRYKTLNPIRALKLFKTQLRDTMSASKVNCFFSNSQTIKDTTSKSIFLDSNKIIVIYRGRDSELFKRDANQKLKDSIFPGFEKIFLNVGRLIPQKGQKDLIEAFALYLKEGGLKDGLAIAGSGPDLKKLRKLAMDLNIIDHVKFLGRRNDIPDLLAISDFFVFPSYYEGLPGSLIEAIFSRTPIIASDIPENKECVGKNTTLIYKSGMVKNLVEKLLYARKNPEEMQLKVDAGYTHALKNFQIQEISRIYENQYDRLLG
ncbi:MAG: glycosyltransferase [Bacteroidota bacterium]